MKERIRAIMAQVFKIDPASITDDSSPETISGWDSAGHMMLVTTLEAELDIQIDDDDLVTMISLPQIVASVEKAQGQA